jgi:hypothetical protein
MKKRYKIRKEQLERVVESFVAESNKQAITEKKGLSEEGDLNEIWPFNKKTPEQMVEKGKKRIESDNKAKRIYASFRKKLGEDVGNKYLMYLGGLSHFNQEMISVNYDKKIEAPDGSLGFFVERGKPRGSGVPQGGVFAG